MSGTGESISAPASRDTTDSTSPADGPAVRNVALSVVSHRQNGLVNLLLGDLRRHGGSLARIVITVNVEDPEPLATEGFAIPVDIVRNAGPPKGFGANHNAAFRLTSEPYFCVCNPDIRLEADPFPALIEALQAPNAGVVGPRVVNPKGEVEDSARRFPTLGRLVRKALFGSKGPDYPITSDVQEVDWVAGMFMLFPRERFAEVGGFDERYFLYYEDIDLCARTWLAGFSMLYFSKAKVTHAAQRASRRSIHHARLHATSIVTWLRSGTLSDMRHLGRVTDSCHCVAKSAAKASRQLQRTRR